MVVLAIFDPKTLPGSLKSFIKVVNRLFGFGFGILSLSSVSPDAESFRAFDLDQSLVMGAMTSGF